MGYLSTTIKSSILSSSGSLPKLSNLSKLSFTAKRNFIKDIRRHLYSDYSNIFNLVEARYSPGFKLQYYPHVYEPIMLDK